VDKLDSIPCHINWAIVNAPAYGTTDSEKGTPSTRQGYGTDVKLSQAFKFDAKTCPMTLHHGGKDIWAPQTSTLVYRQLRRMGIPAELHLYPDKGHAALGLDRMKHRALKGVINSVTNIPMMNPDIVTGVSMMLLFVALGGVMGLSNVLGKWTMLIAHITFILPYVILSVLPRFRQFDNSLREAALDLGCTPAKSFFKVELPAILPGILSGFVMGFTLSLDDFVISHFVSSPDFQTLPLYIYNQTAHAVKYSMYALCTLIIVTILLLLLAVNFAGSLGGKKKEGAK
jgi:ABC-type spermidine/putrescine transport system permease subunit II